MRIAIVHYHLQTGGVTRIIEHAVSGLRDQGVELAILSGTPPEREWPVPVRVVPTLAYGEQEQVCTPQSLAIDLESAARDALNGSPDVWHVHNHSLGKNLALPEALFRIAQGGARLLLQVHDFPEDGRPANYRRLLEHTGGGDRHRLMRYLYPGAAHIHYAVLNGRDQASLLGAGLSSGRLHLLPNPVWLEEDEPPTDEERQGGERLWLYPTRAIRRKNLGELLLLSAISAEGDRFATTRGPQNPAELPIYNGWVDFAGSLGLPVTFEIGMGYAGSFASLLRSAFALVTTSVAEGFGMAFLEPWLAGRPVAGRNLPEITHEFEAQGVDLGGMYERLEVPLDWVGRDLLLSKAQAGLKRVLGAYGIQPGPDDAERTLSAWVRDAGVDFGRLDEELQQQIIRRVFNSASARSELAPWQQLAGPEDQRARIRKNRHTIRENFSLEHYGPRLLEIYSGIMEAPTGKLDALSGEAILASFLAPERLFLLRT